MVKLWDSKLVKLRQDMNIHAIVKRIGEKADAVEIKQAFDEQVARVEQLENTFIRIIDEVEVLNKESDVLKTQIIDLASK